ncbi:LolA family protein [Sporolactobacillus spathodeae]|uniref:Outer membrane lipoprotein-sorting protein n=1 Tax=Sporolactobacillus spathodeae TaxID=1465502 RepID=A0ABS2QAW2_9BACL|nr:outer membrane lipoprotein carrier protein LolA [Sporolactobacillus spathodeae]MBM7658942.1 outer membrane lipoprotein-sorting protein [Sporolactobacillus spathodeae]
MKKWPMLWLVAILIGILTLSGCGTKSEKAVVQDLGNKLDKMNSYQTDATMTFEHNGKKQKYQANITFKKPYYYRVALSDSKKQNQQMILRNANGVFVLTPQLNKSYQFESNWPNNRSQAYLYNTLVKDIVNDPNPNFKVKENQYVFDTKTNYNTTQLANQTITLNKNLAPQKVQVKDKDQNIVVTVVFKNFKFNPNLDKKTFDVKKNMTAAKIKATESATASNTPFKVQYPTAKIGGTKLSLMKPEVTETGEKYILKYAGKKPFTLIESQSRQNMTVAPTLAAGDPANLGFAIGAVSNQTLSWSYGGTDYYLASNAMTQDELITVAQSVNGNVVK